MNGNWGKILRVDLTSGEMEDWEIEERLYRDFIGGSGLAAWLFFQLEGHKAEPLSPQNPLFFLNGPISGTTLPGSSRLEVCARSPLTCIWGEASMGGQVSPELKGAGYDGVVFTGASDKPVYLYLTEEGAELRDASHLWGKDTFDTEELLKEELEDKRVKVISIGPAGENLVKYASVVNDRGSLAGRGGMGAVMGSKKLKAVAVKGKRKSGIADQEAYKRLRKEALENMKKDIFTEGMHLYGTSLGIDLCSAICDLPVKNWREAQWLEGMEELSGARMNKTILTDRHACYACPVACKRIVEVKGGDYAMEEGPGPEYECLGALGFMPRVGDLHAVVKANQLCNAYGMDAISTGGTIAYAIEAFENGLITEKDTEGMALDWGRPDNLVELVRKIAFREGFGDELAEGCRVMSQKYGGEELAIHVKGMECPMHDPRALWSMAVGYATSIRGACHNKDINLGLEMGISALEEIGYPATKAQDREGKAMQTIHGQGIASVCDSAVICIFAWKGISYTLGSLRDMLNAVTGFGYTNEELLEVGQRIWYLKRAIGNLCGMTREDDQVPQRIINPHLEGTASDAVKALYRIMSLDSKVAKRIRGERAVKYYKLMLDKLLIPNIYRILTFIARLMSLGGGKKRRFMRAYVEETVRRRVDFDQMLDEYYRLRRIDERGYPERDALNELGLNDVSRVLHGES
jgi:aldehyde:ferredoxin oxidoreductase